MKKDYKRGDILNQDGIDYICMGYGDFYLSIRAFHDIPRTMNLYPLKDGKIDTITTGHIGTDDNMLYFMKKEDYDKHFTKEEPKKKYMILVPHGNNLHVYHFQEGDFDTSLDGGDIKHITNDSCGAIIIEGDVIPPHSYKDVVEYVMKTVKHFVVK